MNSNLSLSLSFFFPFLPSMVTHVSIFVLEKMHLLRNMILKNKIHLRLILCSSRLSEHRVKAGHSLKKKKKK